MMEVIKLKREGLNLASSTLESDFRSRFPEEMLGESLSNFSGIIT